MKRLWSLAARATHRGFGTQTPSRTFASASRKRNAGLLILPIEGEMAAPDMATAAGSERSRRCFFRRDPSYVVVFIAPTSGPPIVCALKVKLVTDLPGGVAPGSEMFAAAQTMSDGHLSRAVFEIGTSLSNSRSTATPSLLSCSIPALARSAPTSSGDTRFSANAVHSLRL